MNFTWADGFINGILPHREQPHRETDPDGNTITELGAIGGPGTTGTDSRCENEENTSNETYVGGFAFAEKVEEVQERTFTDNKYQQLLDGGFVIFIAHKLEEILQELLTDVITWCPDYLNYLKSKYYDERDATKASEVGSQVDSFIRKVKSTAPGNNNMSSLKLQIYEVLDCFTLPLGSLIREIVTCLQNELTNPNKLTITVPEDKKEKDLEIKNHFNAKMWHKCVNGELPRLGDMDDGVIERLRFMSWLRNDVSHHGTTRPCLELKPEERRKLGDVYNSIIDSDIMKLVETEKTEFDLVDVTDLGKIIESLTRLQAANTSYEDSGDSSQARSENDKLREELANVQQRLKFEQEEISKLKNEKKVLEKENEDLSDKILKLHQENDSLTKFKNKHEKSKANSKR